MNERYLIERKLWRDTDGEIYSIILMSDEVMQMIYNFLLHTNRTAEQTDYLNIFESEIKKRKKKGVN